MIRYLYACCYFFFFFVAPFVLVKRGVTFPKRLSGQAVVLEKRGPGNRKCARLVLLLLWSRVIRNPNDYGVCVCVCSSH